MQWWTKKIPESIHDQPMACELRFVRANCVGEFNQITDHQNRLRVQRIFKHRIVPAMPILRVDQFFEIIEKVKEHAFRNSTYLRVNVIMRRM